MVQRMNFQEHSGHSGSVCLYIHRCGSDWQISTIIGRIAVSFATITSAIFLKSERKAEMPG